MDPLRVAHPVGIHPERLPRHPKVDDSTTAKAHQAGLRPLETMSLISTDKGGGGGHSFASYEYNTLRMAHGLI